jgi:anaerobic selenocysteine-containing dehydrogenase
MMARRGKEDPHRTRPLSRDGPGPGRSTAGSSTTGPRLIRRDSPGIRNGRLLKWNAKRKNAGKAISSTVADRLRDGDPRRQTALHHEAGRHCLDFRPRSGRRAVPGALRGLECPLEKNSMSGQRINPTIKIFGDKMDAFSPATRFPFVGTTYRVSEHWQTGCHDATLFLAAGNAAPELRRDERGTGQGTEYNNGETVVVSSGRGEVKAVAMVSERFKPFKIAGSTVHQVGLPWHFGWQFPEDGSGYDSANLLTPNVGDANTMIPESKAFMVNVRKA